MDAPQLPDAETAAPRTGAHPPGQASAFRRALDAQAEPPSANGPTVVMPAVSVPTLHARTVIARPSATDEDSRDKVGDEGRSSRLPTTVGISILLAVAAGTALVMLNLGHTGEPLAPTAMPTKPAATDSLTPQASPSPSQKANASAASPSHTVTSAPSRSAAASQTAPSGHASGNGGSFATIYWTNDPEQIVVDIQTRLARLGYLELSPDGARYDITQRTLDDVQRQSVPDGVGYYQYSTDSAIRAFEFDYLQHRQGQLPGGGCSSQTYRTLVQATS